MSDVLVVISVVELVVCLAVAGLLAVRWREHPTTATSSAFGIFAVVALVISSGVWQPDDPTRGVGAVYVELVVIVLLALPYLLTRLAWALGGVGNGVHRAMVAVYAAEVVGTVAAPPLPAEGAPRPGWVIGYIVAVLAAWSVQSTVAAVGLWRAGRGESAVVRHRMQTLALGALVMTLTLVLSGASPQSSGGGALVLALLGLLSILLFVLAFLLPSSLRIVWRQADLAALSAAERELMTATARSQVADTIVPVLASVLGGGTAALLDAEGTPVRAVGSLDPAVTRLLTPAADPGGAAVQQVRPGVLAARADDGWLVVQAGRLAPVFGDDEAVLLGRVATLVDLALQRARLFEQERASREAAEAVGADLETLLYSVSHDLRSPLISVLGYLDVLRAEHGEQLSGEGTHYLERISVNALYMQRLISDLLELSRIGRNDGADGPLDLHAVALEVGEAARLRAPKATITVEGTLPAVLVSDVRARQLLTNLVDNALQHGGRDDVRVTVRAADAADGGLVLQVADDGVGVPPEYRERVVRVFERLDARKSGTGTGMGLAICKRICEVLGGTLRIGDPPPGSATGTTISIVLPSAVRATAAVPAPRGTGRATSEELV